jgi:hypothetical protein
MNNDEDEDSEDEGSWGVRGAVQDSAEGLYEPRPKFVDPARESCSRGAKTAAKVAPAAQGTAATANGHEWQHQQDFRNGPEPSPWGGTGGYSGLPLADSAPPDEGGAVQLISCLSVKGAAPAKSLDVVPPIKTVKGGALRAHWWRDNRDFTMAKF